MPDRETRSKLKWMVGLAVLARRKAGLPPVLVCRFRKASVAAVLARQKAGLPVALLRPTRNAEQSQQSMTTTRWQAAEEARRCKPGQHAAPASYAQQFPRNSNTARWAALQTKQSFALPMP